MRIADLPVMTKRIVTATLLALCLAAVGAPAALAAPVQSRPAATAAAPAATTESAAPARNDRARDAARYAAAEKKQPRAAEFEGGARIVIVGSTAAIVLGVVLLAIIL